LLQKVCFLDLIKNNFKDELRSLQIYSCWTTAETFTEAQVWEVLRTILVLRQKFSGLSIDDDARFQTWVLNCYDLDLKLALDSKYYGVFCWCWKFSYAPQFWPI